MILIILLSLLIAGLLSIWFVVPLALLTSRRWAAQFGVPTSLAATVIVGYVSYLAGQFAHFAALLVVAMVGSNVLAVVLGRGRIRLLWNALRVRPLRLSMRPALASALLAALVCVAVLYASFFDAITFSSPATPDAFALWDYLQVIAEGDPILGYPPGWFALIEPGHSVLPNEAAWRFMSPSLGVASLAGLYALARPFVGGRFAAVFVLLLLSPVGGPATRWMGGFWPTSVTVLFVLAATAALMQIASMPRSERYRVPVTLVAVGVAMAVCSPLPAIQWGAAAILALGSGVVIMTMQSGRIQDAVSGAAPCIAGCLLVLAVAGAVPYIAPTGLVPWVAPAELGETIQTRSDDRPKSESPSRAESGGPKSESPSRAESGGPVGAFVDVARAMTTIKFTGPLPGPLQLKLGAPLLILLALLAMYLSRAAPRSPLMILAFVSFCFGVILQTGFLTPYLYTGRVAVYGIVLGLLLVVLLLRGAWCRSSLQMSPEAIRRGITVFALAVLVAVVCRPPQWLRVLAPDAAYVIADDIRSTHQTPTRVQTNVVGLQLLDDLEVEALGVDPPRLGVGALIIDVGYRESSPPGSNQGLFFAGGYTEGAAAIADRAAFADRQRLLRAARGWGWKVVRRVDGVVLMVRERLP